MPVCHPARSIGSVDALIGMLPIPIPPPFEEYPASKAVPDGRRRKAVSKDAWSEQAEGERNEIDRNEQACVFGARCYGGGCRGYGSCGVCAERYVELSRGCRCRRENGRASGGSSIGHARNGYLVRYSESHNRYRRREELRRYRRRGWSCGPRGCSDCGRKRRIGGGSRNAQYVPNSSNSRRKPTCTHLRATSETGTLWVCGSAA